MPDLIKSRRIIIHLWKANCTIHWNQVRRYFKENKESSPRKKGKIGIGIPPRKWGCSFDVQAFIVIFVGS